MCTYLEPLLHDLDVQESAVPRWHGEDHDHQCDTRGRRFRGEQQTFPLLKNLVLYTFQTQTIRDTSKMSCVNSASPTTDLWTTDTHFPFLAGREYMLKARIRNVNRCASVGNPNDLRGGYRGRVFVSMKILRLRRDQNTGFSLSKGDTKISVQHSPSLRWTICIQHIYS